MCGRIHENNRADLIWAISSLLIYIFGLCGSALANGEIGGENSNLSASGWIFVIIWPIIYANQFIWHLYFIYQNLKQPKITESSGEYSSYLMYSTQTGKGKLFFLSWIISNLLQFGWWLCVSQREYTGAAVVILFYCIAVCVANIFPHKYFYDISQMNLNPPRIPSSNTFYIIVFLNLIQIYGTWLTLANMISWSAELYRNDIIDDPETPAIIFLIVLIVILVIYLYLDLFRFKEYLRYTYITYIVVIAASFAVLTEFNFDFSLVSQIITLCIIIFTSIMLIIKIIFIGCKSEYKNVGNDGLQSEDDDKQKLNQAELNAQV